MEKEKDKLKEKVKRVFRKIVLAGSILTSSLTPSYPAAMYYAKYSKEAFPNYKYEVSLIEKGDEYNRRLSSEDYIYYKKAKDLIEKKHRKIGEGKDIQLDFLRVYSVYAMARAPPEPEYAEPYLLEAKELAKKYYEIWKNPVFLDLEVTILENLGHIYFVTAEFVRNGDKCIILLNSPTSDFEEIEKTRLLSDPHKIGIVRSMYPVGKIINSKNFTEILYYYEIAKKWYEEYLRFYKESGLEKIVKDYPVAAEDYKERNERVLSHLKIIDEILSKYKPDYKKEEKVETKEEKKEEEKKEEKINWKELGNRDIQEGL